MSWRCPHSLCGWRLPGSGQPHQPFPCSSHSALASGEIPQGWILPFVDCLCQAGSLKPQVIPEAFDLQRKCFRLNC